VAWQQENLGLLDPKDEGTTLFWNICNYLPFLMA
jgi:hypothetical protein